MQPEHQLAPAACKWALSCMPLATRMVSINGGPGCAPNTHHAVMQLIVAPLRRLGINKSGTPLEQVGTPESVLGSIGAFISGAVCNP